MKFALSTNEQKKVAPGGVAIGFYAKIPGTQMGLNAVAISLVFRSYFDRALKPCLSTEPLPLLDGREANPCHVLAVGNWFYGLFVVSDHRQGISILRRELQELHMLPFSEIAWRDDAEQIWRTVHPELCRLRFERHLLITRRAGAGPDNHGGAGIPTP